MHTLYYFKKHRYGTHNYFIQKNILKINHTTLFIYLKIILLQYLFFNEINCIQMDP